MVQLTSGALANPSHDLWNHMVYQRHNEVDTVIDITSLFLFSKNIGPGFDLLITMA